MFSSACLNLSVCGDIGEKRNGGHSPPAQIESTRGLVQVGHFSCLRLKRVLGNLNGEQESIKVKLELNLPDSVFKRFGGYFSADSSPVHFT